MTVKNGYNPGAGQQQPTKYPFVGANYQKYGEQPGYVYYPWKDEYYIDPKAAKEYGQANGTIAPDPEKPSLANTVLPIAAAGGALALGQGLGKDPSGFVKGIGEGLGLVGGKDGGLLGIGAEGAGTTAATAASQGANAAAAGPGGLMSIGGAAAPGEAIGSLANGGTMTTMSPAAMPGNGAAGLGVAPYLGAASALAGGYGLYNSINANDKKGGALSGAALGGGLAAASPLLLGAGPVGWGVLGAATLGGGLLGLGAVSAFGHESTRDVAKKHTNQLLSKGKDDPAWQGYVSGMRQQHSAPPPDPSKPFLGGKFATFDEYKAAGLNATDLSGVYGNLETYGPDWAKYSQQEREAITQANINKGLYNSKKGEVILSNKNEALKSRDEVLGGKVTPTPGQQQVRPAALPAGSVKNPGGLLSVGAR